MVNKKTLGTVGGISALTLFVAAYLLVHPGSQPQNICYCPIIHENNAFYFGGGLNADGSRGYFDTSNKSYKDCRVGKLLDKWVCGTNSSLKKVIPCSASIDGSGRAWCA